LTPCFITLWIIYFGGKHTHTQAHTLTLIHTGTHTNTHIDTDTHTHTKKCSHFPSHTHIHTYTQTRTYVLSVCTTKTQFIFNVFFLILQNARFRTLEWFGKCSFIVCFFTQNVSHINNGSSLCNQNVVPQKCIFS